MRSMDVWVIQIYKQSIVGSKINTETGARREFFFTLIDAIFKYS